MFTTNVGTPDRIIRIVIGLVLVALPFALGAALPGWLAIGLPIVGLVLFLTAFIAFCPIYRVLGVSTASRKDV
jgi:hypothetical protein